MRQLGAACHVDGIDGSAQRIQARGDVRAGGDGLLRDSLQRILRRRGLGLGVGEGSGKQQREGGKSVQGVRSHGLFFVSAARVLRKKPGPPTHICGGTAEYFTGTHPDIAFSQRGCCSRAMRLKSSSALTKN